VEELLLAALARTLGEWTGAPRHLVELERHDRPPLFDDVDVTRTIGWFSRTHPLVLTADGAGTLRAVTEALRAVPAGGTGWPLLRQGRDPLPTPPVDLLFGYTGRAVEPASGAFAVAAETLGGDRSPLGRRPHPIEVRAGVLHGELVTSWGYSALRHDGATVERLAARFDAELRGLVGAGDGARDAADFPLARVDRAQLDGLLGRLAGG
jgi:non-ribosomal peptide synthase protein (TIGR01720 family)